MDTRIITLFIFDTPENFEKSKPHIGIRNYKNVFCIETVEELKHHFAAMSKDELIFCVIHVFYTTQLAGAHNFKLSGIIKEYPKFGYHYVSDGDETQIKHQLVDAKLPIHPVWKYHEIQSNLEEMKFLPIEKEYFTKTSPNLTETNDLFPQIDYAVITALYDDEFEELKQLFDFPKDETIKTKTKHYSIGYLKSNRSKKIVAAVPAATGMVDSAIVATQMLNMFRPKYLMMSGVCGGDESLSFGDIVVAKQIFTFQKGKISDIRDRSGSIIDLFDKERKKIDYGQLFDSNGNQISISIEKFEMEHDSIINLSATFVDALNPEKGRIKDRINAHIRERGFFKEEHQIKIEIEPMACSTMVINKEGYFIDTIKSVNRKTLAVEMESYGVARACEIANDGQTTSIIFKAVMDHTKKKADFLGDFNNKKFASFTSALFLKYLLEFEII